MKSLYLRIWLTVLLTLGLFAAGSAWLYQQHLSQERLRVEEQARGRMAVWTDLIERSLAQADASAEEQAEALNEWSRRLRLPLALDDAQGQRLVASPSWRERSAQGDDLQRRALAIRLDDGRVLWVARGGRGMRPPPGVAGHHPGHEGLHDALAGSSARRAWDALPPPPPSSPWLAWWPWPSGLGLLAFMVLLFVGVAAGAWPVVRRLTARLEALQRGVETFGQGELAHRVAVQGHDEVASVAASFNQAAERVQALVQSHRSLLANASHELRSPLTRMKMALSMLEEAAPEQRSRWAQEVHTNIAELDALVEEVLLASRLDASTQAPAREPVALLPLLAEEAARVQALAEGADVQVLGDERLLRRAVRNLLENARRHAGGTIEARVQREADGAVSLWVCDRGPGVPADWRERIFEPFMRLPGHGEKEGSVGLGLSLVRQIARAHQGEVRCEARDGGGSCFVIRLPGSRP